jgi:repressor LexA
MGKTGKRGKVAGAGTRRQRAGDALRERILQMIEAYGGEHGRPPTIREIGAAVGIKTPSQVAYHVGVLEAEGLLRREAGTSRGLLSTRPTGVRVLGAIAAGEPLELFDAGEAELLELGEVAVMPAPVRAGKAIYALRVRGVSMIEDGILDGDYVLVEPSPTAANGAIAVVVQDSANGGRGAATLKRVFREAGGVRLQPANAMLAPRVVPAAEWTREWSVQGRVVAVCRRYMLR